jgi:hypothetical protein
MGSVWFSGADKTQPDAAWAGAAGAAPAKEIELTVTDDVSAAPGGVKEAEKHIEL